MSIAGRLPIILAVAVALPAGASAEGAPARPGLAERLGHDKDAKLLIVYADDVGSSHAINLATFDAPASGQETSASVMVPCAELPEVADYAARRPAPGARRRTWASTSR